jgi:hypothetical protein
VKVFGFSLLLLNLGNYQASWLPLPPLLWGRRVVRPDLFFPEDKRAPSLLEDTQRWWQPWQNRAVWAIIVREAQVPGFGCFTTQIGTGCSAHPLCMSSIAFSLRLSQRTRVLWTVTNRGCCSRQDSARTLTRATRSSNMRNNCRLMSIGPYQRKSLYWDPVSLTDTWIK